MAMAIPRTPTLMIVKNDLRQFLKYWPWFMWNQKMAGSPTVRYKLARAGVRVSMRSQVLQLNQLPKSALCELVVR